MEHLMTVPKRCWLIYRRLKITVNQRKSARRKQDQKGMIFKNFKDGSDNFHSVNIVFLYNMVLSVAILIFALCFFREY